MHSYIITKGVHNHRHRNGGGGGLHGLDPPINLWQLYDKQFWDSCDTIACSQSGGPSLQPIVNYVVVQPICSNYVVV